VVNQTGPGPHRSGRRRRSRRRTRGTGSAFKQLDPLDAIRLSSLPVGLGASAWARSPWWFVAAAAYNVAGGPIHDFLATVLDAAADRLADRIHKGRPRARAPAMQEPTADSPALGPRPPSRPRSMRSPASATPDRQEPRRRRRPGRGQPEGRAPGPREQPAPKDE